MNALSFTNLNSNSWQRLVGDNGNSYNGVIKGVNDKTKTDYLTYMPNNSSTYQTIGTSQNNTIEINNLSNNKVEELRSGGGSDNYLVITTKDSNSTLKSFDSSSRIQIDQSITPTQNFSINNNTIQYFDTQAGIYGNNIVVVEGSVSSNDLQQDLNRFRQQDPQNPSNYFIKR